MGTLRFRLKMQNPGLRQFAYALSVFLTAILGFAFVISANYPGYLNGDSLHQLREALSKTYGDWHSPSITMLWSVLLDFLPGPVGFIVFDNLLIWSALAGLALALRPRLGAWSYLILFMPLLPGAFNYLGHVHTDAMLAAILLAGASLAYLAQRDWRSRRLAICLQIAANLFIAAGFLTRLNAVFCLIPLLLYANSNLGARRTILLSGAVLAVLPLIYSVQNTLLQVPNSHPGDSIKTYQLLALSYHEQENQFPGKWHEEEARQIVESCYSPVQWDTASNWGQCRFISQNLRAQGLWGSRTLTESWLKAIIDHPRSYFAMLVPTFKKSMFDPNSRQMLYSADNPWGWMVQDNPPRPDTQIAQDYARSKFNDRVGRPWVFGLLSVIGLLTLFRLNLHSTKEGRFALAVLLSGLIYLITYFFFNVSAEYRYFYWCGFAAYLGLIIVILCALKTARKRPPTATRSHAERAVKLTSLVIAAFSTGMITFAFTFNLPATKRIITLTPLDEKPVSVTRIGSTATPLWMAPAFEGDTRPMTWDWIGHAYQSTSRLSPVVASLDGLRQTIEIKLETGPDNGRVAIDEVGMHRVVDTYSEQPGIQTIQLPPSPGEQRKKRRFNTGVSNTALIYVLGLLFLFLRLTRARAAQ